MHDILVWIETTNWGALLSGAALGAIGLGLRSAIQAPVKAMTERSLFIRLFHRISPQAPFVGKWEVTWKVTSDRFPESNLDTVQVYSLFGNVTFTTQTRLRDGTVESCKFVGKLVDKTLTGRWFDPKDVDRSYFGVYQVKLHGGLRDAKGTWIGWTNHGEIQANEMSMRRAT